MRQNPIPSAIGLLLIVVISVALIGYLAFGQDGAVTETVHVGSEGIKKAQEVKRAFEESSQSQLGI